MSRAKLAEAFGDALPVIDAYRHHRAPAEEFINLYAALAENVDGVEQVTYFNHETQGYAQMFFAEDPDEAIERIAVLMGNLQDGCDKLIQLPSSVMIYK